MNTPDYWQLLKITQNNKTVYKIFATWVGGYLGEDTWKLNSGITEISEENNYYDFIGASGSVYRCGKNEHLYRNSGYSKLVLNNLIKRTKEIDADVRVVDFDNLKKELKKI